jgi:hypothetical protein
MTLLFLSVFLPLVGTGVMHTNSRMGYKPNIHPRFTLSEWSGTSLLTVGSDADDYAPSITTDVKGNLYVVWSENPGTDADIVYKVWTRLTDTWGDTTLVSTESTDNAYSVDSFTDVWGNLHIVWLDETDTYGGSDSDVLYKFWNATTDTWSAAELVSIGSTDWEFEPAVAVDASGIVHVAWPDPTSAYGGSDYDILYGRRNSSGLWEPTELVSSESTSTSRYCEVAVDPDGNCHVVWEDLTSSLGGSDYDIIHKSRNATTGGWTTSVVVSTTSTGGSYTPDIDVDSLGNLHCVWDDRTSGVHLYYKQFSYVTKTWGSLETPFTAGSGGTADKPCIAVDAANNAHVSWEDATNDDGENDIDINYIQRFSNGTWSTSSWVSTGSDEHAENPSMAVDNSGQAHITWDDTTWELGGWDSDILYNDFTMPDRDLDQLTDFFEIYTSGTDPDLFDTDYDNLSDHDEMLIYGTSPFSVDSDNDNFLDAYEVDYGSDPLDSLSYPGMPAEWYANLEGNATLLQQVITWLDGNYSAIQTLFFYLEGNASLLVSTVNALDGNATQLELVAAIATQNTALLTQMNASMIGDIDDIRAVLAALGVTVGDSDYDSLDDLDEIAYGTDILAIDTDVDNLNDAFEIKIGTDPLNDDSDADSYLDGVEFMAGTDPMNALSYPGSSPLNISMVLGIVMGASGMTIVIVVVLLLRRRRSV